MCFCTIVRHGSVPTCLCGNTSRTCLVYNTELTNSLYFQLGRLWPKISSYKQKIESRQADKSNDIPFNAAYQDMLNRIDNSRNFISLILHIDGISLCKSTKHTLWLFSGVIIELPPELRYRRENMILLSIYVGQAEPTTKVWLESCMPKLLRLKDEGKIRFFIQTIDFSSINSIAKSFGFDKALYKAIWFSMTTLEF